MRCCVEREGDLCEKARAQRDLEKIKAQQIALDIAKNYMDRLTSSEDNIRILEKELEDLNKKQMTQCNLCVESS